MRFIPGHALVNLLSPIEISLYGIHIILCLSVRTFLGLVGKVASPPIKFTPTFWSGWNLPIGFVLFYKLYSKHFGLSTKKLRALLHSWGFPFQIYLSGALWRRLWCFRGEILLLPCDLDLLSHPILLGSTLLFLGLWSLECSSGTVLYGSCFSQRFLFFSEGL